MVVVKHSWFKFGQTGHSLFLQVPQLGWSLCSWTVLFERFQQTVSSSLFLWYWIFVVICGGAFFPRISEIQEMNHLFQDVQEVYSTSIPVDFVSRVSFLAHPTPTIYWTSSPSWPSSPSSPYRLSWHILTILTILTVLPAFENDLIWCSFRPLLVWSASLSRTFQGLWDMLAGSPGETVLFSVGSPPLSGFRVGFPVGMHFRMEHPVDLGPASRLDSQLAGSTSFPFGNQGWCWFNFLETEADSINRFILDGFDKVEDGCGQT